ncbi:MAG: hypothetical protein PHU81_06355 [Acidobacteriota bacterium]|nr:hypothetical protein [Acidobacteriota bacterium]
MKINDRADPYRLSPTRIVQPLADIDLLEEKLKLANFLPGRRLLQ